MSLRSKRGFKEFETEYQKEQERQEQERTAPIRAAENELSRVHAELLQAQRDTLYTVQNPDLNLPQYQGNYSAEEVTRRIGEAFTAFKLWLSEQGMTLTEKGIECFHRLVVLYGTADTTNRETFVKLFQYADSLNAFSDREVERPAPALIEPAPVESVDIESVDTSTRSGEKAARRLTNDAWMKESKPLFFEFIRHMRETWEHPMTQADQDKVCRFLYDNNLGITAKSLDFARQKVLGCLTPDEKLAAEIESSEVPVGDYSVRRDIASRIREVTQ